MSKWAGRRRKLAEARAAVQKDAEAWIRIALAIEGLAAWLKPNGGGGLASALTTIRSTLFSDNEWTSAGPQGGPSPEVLGERLRLARNAQVHEGALARSTAGPAIALSLIIEGKLMEKDGQGAGTIEAWMVPKPQIAEGYETLSEIRSRMVSEGFSYLPWWNSRRGRWKVVRDVDLIEALAGPGAKATTLEEAAGGPDGCLRTFRPVEFERNTSLDEARKALLQNEGLPLLVVSSTRPKNGDPRQVLGILTAHDLLLSV